MPWECSSCEFSGGPRMGTFKKACTSASPFSTSVCSSEKRQLRVLANVYELIGNKRWHLLPILHARRASHREGSVVSCWPWATLTTFVPTP